MLPPPKPPPMPPHPIARVFVEPDTVDTEPCADKPTEHPSCNAIELMEPDVQDLKSDVKDLTLDVGALKESSTRHGKRITVLETNSQTKELRLSRGDEQFTEIHTKLTTIVSILHTSQIRAWGVRGVELLIIGVACIVGAVIGAAAFWFVRFR
jgi:hypothetical protein